MDHNLMSSSSTSLQISARRRVLFSVISAICQEAGFSSIDNYVLDILLQLFQAFLSELSFSAKQFCEHSGRTEPLPGDVFMGLIEMGFNIQSLPAYALRPNRLIIPTPPQMPKQVLPKILQTGKKKQLFSYIPDYFPPFPDSHSYISTPTHKQPITEYETLREKSSTQKRDVERALTRFMARTFTSSYTYSLFPDEQLSQLFPLIGIKNDIVPYLSALLPKDQMWENDNTVNKSKSSQTKDKKSNNSDILNNSLDNVKDNMDASFTSNDVEITDNPFLRTPKVVNFDFPCIS